MVNKKKKNTIKPVDKAQVLLLNFDFQQKKKMYFSTAKAKRELGYNPRPAKEAIKDAVAWFLNWGK